jgi:hypothetical protein
MLQPLKNCQNDGEKKVGYCCALLKKKNSNKPIEIKVKLTAPFAPAVNHQLPTPC